MSLFLTEFDIHFHNIEKNGENGHIEYGWSNNVREKILQFSFQLTRTDKYGLNKLKIILNDLLITLKYKVNNLNIYQMELRKEYLSIFLFSYILLNIYDSITVSNNNIMKFVIKYAETSPALLATKSFIKYVEDI